MKKTDTTCICSYDANYGCHGHAMAVMVVVMPDLLISHNNISKQEIG